MTPAASTQFTAGAALLRRALASHLVVCSARVHRGWPSEALGADVAAEVVRESGTRACVLHVPSHDDLDSGDAVPYDQQRCWFPGGHPVTFFNTSGAVSGADCAATVRLLHQWASAQPQLAEQYLFKLEVFDASLHSCDAAIIDAVELLDPDLRSLCVPIIEPVRESAERLLELGVAGLRLRAGEIRRGTGILLEAECRHTIEAIDGRVQVMLEGGLAGVDDIRRAAAMGADAVLFNTAVAVHPDPVLFAKQLRSAADRYWR
ncbi:MAG TPA: hypothetical protein DCR14_17355 [Acidimicrobiaceae bacterium]|nr:hypothetical protein [Acidimicrobiaceae bacterium]